MKIFKKQGAGTWISLVTIILSVVALFIYKAALKAGTGLMIASGSEMFYEVTRESDAAMIANVEMFTYIAIAALAFAVIFGHLKENDMLVGAMRIVAPALLLGATLYFLYGSFTGLGWTFFSNEELEIYPEAIETGKQVIMALAVMAVAAIMSLLASFCSLKHSNAEVEAKEAKKAAKKEKKAAKKAEKEA